MGKKIDDFESDYKDLLWRGVSHMKMGWKIKKGMEGGFMNSYNQGY